MVVLFASLAIAHFVNESQKEDDPGLQPIVDIFPAYMLELSLSLFIFCVFSFFLFLLAKRILTMRYSFDFFITNLFGLQNILPSSTPLNFFHFLFIFWVIFLFLIQNFISSGIRVIVWFWKIFFENIFSEYCSPKRSTLSPD